MGLKGRAHGMLEQTGVMFAIAGDGVRYTPRIRRWWREYVDQCWFLIRVCIIPVMLITLPLGATISLQVGQLTRQLGAEAATGSAVVLGIVREVSPLAIALLISGAGGSAIAADLGSRNIRDELSAMETMAVNPVHRLVTARLWAASTVGVLLISFVIVAGIAGGYLFNVVVQGVNAGTFFQGATLFVGLPDIVSALVKAAIFGFIAAMVSSYKGMTCERGPAGVGRAVNKAVVTTFILVFVANYVLTTLFFVLAPPKI